MHPQVVKEVVPLAKEHLAAALFVITLKYLYLAHCAWVFVAENPESAGRWDGLLDLNCVKIEVKARLYVDLGVLRHLLLHLAV